MGERKPLKYGKLRPQRLSKPLRSVSNGKIKFITKLSIITIKQESIVVSATHLYFQVNPIAD
jgi:hypothetical protein